MLIYKFLHLFPLISGEQIYLSFTWFKILLHIYLLSNLASEQPIGAQKGLSVSN